MLTVAHSPRTGPEAEQPGEHKVDERRVVVVVAHVLVAVVPEVELHPVDPVPQVRVEHFEHVPGADRVRRVVVREGLGVLLRVFIRVRVRLGALALVPTCDETWIWTEGGRLSCVRYRPCLRQSAVVGLFTF